MTPIPSAATAPVAALANVTKRYGAVTAVADLSLEVRRGEVLAVLGPNGAGKTTSIRLLLGLSKPDAGSAHLFGHHPRHRESRERTGVMLQVAHVPETMTIAEHLELFASYYPAPLGVDEALSLAGLSGLGRRPFGKLSGGQQQRVLFALSIVGNPELLFLDEPTVGMDVEARRSFWNAIRALVDRGRSIVLTTHYLEEADALASRIVVVDHGRVVAEGTPAEIKRKTAGRLIRCTTSLGVDVLGALPGVTSVRVSGTTKELLAAAAEPVVRELLTLDPGLSDLEVTGSGLTEAFLALTSKDPKKEAA